MKHIKTLIDTRYYTDFFFYLKFMLLTYFHADYLAVER